MKENKGRSELTRRLIMRCIFTIIAYTLAVILLVVIAWLLCSSKVWYDYDISYKILNWIEDHIIPVTCICEFGGWLVIFILYVRKSLNFLDEIVRESEKLTDFSGEPIKLSEELYSIQTELNLIREKAINSAAAAKDSEQRKNDLIVYLAHDLKTPLTSVIGYLTLMRDEPQISPELKAKYTGIALDKAERLEELINEFFDITRFNLMNISLEKENINFTRLIEQTAYEFEPILAEKGLTWDMSFEKDIHILCDADKTERVIDNLIKNAVSYSYPDTEIKLKLFQDDSFAVFSVENCGKTISEEKLSRIFEQFFRVDSSRSTKSGGAGLGLAIAKEITELHGGSISAESENQIIRFTVRLPL